MNIRTKDIHFWRSFGPHLTGGIAALIVLLMFGNAKGTSGAVRALELSAWLGAEALYYLLFRYKGGLKG